MTNTKWSAFDLVEAYQLSRAVAVLNDLNVFESEKPFTARKLAAKHGLDLKLLAGVLEYVALRTELLRETARGQFTATRNASRFLIDLYTGAYGSTADQLPHILRDPELATASVDRVRYARAFNSLDRTVQGILPDVVRALEFNYTLDLGCGNGDLLLELARRDAEFVGWGVDSNPAMLKVARSRAAGTGKRVQFLEADCTRLPETVSTKIRSQIRSVTCCNVANEMFGHGERQAIKWFRDLRKLFPGRALLNCDYYGRLGRSKNRKLQRKTLLHDYAQLISGQGVPPATRSEWRSIYSHAGCRLVHAIEDTSTTRFIHIIGL